MSIMIHLDDITNPIKAKSTCKDCPQRVPHNAERTEFTCSLNNYALLSADDDDKEQRECRFIHQELLRRKQWAFDHPIEVEKDALEIMTNCLSEEEYRHFLLGSIIEHVLCFENKKDKPAEANQILKYATHLEELCE